VLCPDYHDYIKLVNSNGGVEGYRVRVEEIDHEYKVPPAWRRMNALAKKLEEDKILGTSPGFGTAAAADGRRYPYIFPIAASYWSQGAAAVSFAKKELGGSLKDKKIGLPVL